MVIGLMSVAAVVSSRSTPVLATCKARWPRTTIFPARLLALPMARTVRSTYSILVYWSLVRYNTDYVACMRALANVRTIVLRPQSDQVDDVPETDAPSSIQLGPAPDADLAPGRVH